MGAEALVSSIEQQMRDYRQKISRQGRNSLLGSMLEAFSLVSKTLIECEPCTQLVLPVKDLRVRPEDAEQRVVL